MISTDVEGANQLNSTNASKIVRSAMDKYSQAVVGIRSVLKFYFSIYILQIKPASLDRVSQRVNKMKRFFLKSYFSDKRYIRFRKYCKTGNYFE